MANPQPGHDDAPAGGSGLPHPGHDVSNRVPQWAHDCQWGSTSCWHSVHSRMKWLNVSCCFNNDDSSSLWLDCCCLSSSMFSLSMWGIAGTDERYWPPLLMLPIAPRTLYSEYTSKLQYCHRGTRYLTHCQVRDNVFYVRSKTDPLSHYLIMLVGNGSLCRQILNQSDPTPYVHDDDSGGCIMLFVKAFGV